MAAYERGLFPMADENGLGWYDPPLRGQLSIDRPHVSKSLQKLIRRQVFDITFDRDFAGVIRGCATEHGETWISPEIEKVFVELHHLGLAHSVEAWREGKLVGGIYGLALGGVFFGESMFSRESGASKVTLVYLLARLRARGFVLFDTQFINDHLRQFGCYEIPRATYKQHLKKALTITNAQFSSAGMSSCEKSEGFAEVASLLQSITQTS